MKILFIGDISGKPGRKLVAKVLPGIKTKYKPDLVIANCENAAGGLGVTREKLTELLGYGIDFFTSGDHVWRVKDFVEELQDTSMPLIRPYNYEKTADLPGKGYDIIDLGPKGKVYVINLIGQSFMRDIPRNPFWAVDELLDKLGIQDGSKETVIVDFHAETTAEKLSMGEYLSKRVSAVLGTHTHVPTPMPDWLVDAPMSLMLVWSDRWMPLCGSNLTVLSIILNIPSKSARRWRRKAVWSLTRCCSR